MTSFTVPNTFTASTVIASSEMNANFTAVATAFTASLGIAGAETMTGTFKAASGTAALPGITFGADLNSGIFSKAADTLGFSVAGAEIGNWDASNLNLLGGMTLAAALSLTASSPQINLIDSDTGADSRIDADNASGSMVYSADLNNEVANSTHVWALDGTNQMVLTAAALTPAADDGKTLGTTSLQWADLFLASGAVINFNGGNATLTHSTDTLNFAVTNLQHGGAAIATSADVQKTDVQSFTSSGTWTKPSGYASTCAVLVRAWGAGGSGGRAGSGNGGAGGGGGAYLEAWFSLSDLGATETVTVGSGGAAQTTNSDGVAGGDTTFGSILTAYGGGGGAESGTDGSGGGGGGGLLSAGTSATTNVGAAGGNPSGGSGGGLGANGGDSTFGGGGGSGRDSSTGGSTIFGGGGGGGGSSTTSNGATGGDSIYGGGGGGGASDIATPGSGGTSVSGGNGGAGATSTNAATAGSQPGGGGGGSEDADSGAGGDGQVEVYVFAV